MTEPYVKIINTWLKNHLYVDEPFVVFGQNVSAGSRLSGLTRGLDNKGGLQMINTPNCENAMVGFGFGMMLKGVNSCFIVKQHDFLLLTLDQIVNTYNMLRLDQPEASFTIICVVVDSGYEGPQSRLNNLSEFCSLADIPTYAINSSQDVNAVFPQLFSPGFRIIALSQRLFRQPMLDLGAVAKGDGVTHHFTGEDLTVVSFNFSLPQAHQLTLTAGERGLSCDLISYSHAMPRDWSLVLQSALKTNKVVILDDSRSLNRSSDRLRLALYENVPGVKILALQKQPSVDAIPPNADQFDVDAGAILNELFPTVKHHELESNSCEK